MTHWRNFVFLVSESIKVGNFVIFYSAVLVNNSTQFDFWDCIFLQLFNFGAVGLFHPYSTKVSELDLETLCFNEIISIIIFI